VALPLWLSTSKWQRSDLYDRMLTDAQKARRRQPAQLGGLDPLDGQALVRE